MMLKVYKPIAMKFNFHTRKDGLCNFVYSETFKRKLDADTVRRTMEMILSSVPIKIEVTKDGRTLYFERIGINREEVFNMLAGEFLINSALASLTIAQLLALLSMQTASLEEIKATSYHPSKTEEYLKEKNNIVGIALQAIEVEKGKKK